ncbi:hypothetical protein CYLTODRAFT_495328 [Cylindrobasidium torrendii FP15055 ss-10]|uniref:F-box domain-containing protein n=1 Tax=Cylindrobasidium torrendii FP15055 ss-10 TaxID=1314674 RepID=A0A0D7ASV6_9AGAR|nr:hypothetical protein CYLTODRAFT_495328 [Cylindrobasidium torrendii FP15055 ss-10]
MSALSLSVMTRPPGTRTFTALYFALPDELQRDIMILAIHAVKNSLQDDIERGTIIGTVAEAMYASYTRSFKLDLLRRVVLDSIALKDAARYQTFMSSARIIKGVRSGVGSAVRRLVINGRGMDNNIDWMALLEARKHMGRLRTLGLIRVNLPQYDIEVARVVRGLDNVTILSCTLSSSTLAVCASLVPRLSVRQNTFTSNEEDILLGPFHLDYLTLDATSEGERVAYSRVLALVHRVRHLTVRGLKNGWILGDGWSSVEHLESLYGLPNHFVVHPSMSDLTLGVKDIHLDRLLPLIPINYGQSLKIVVEVSLARGAQNLRSLWQILDQCHTETPKVEFFMLCHEIGQEKRFGALRLKENLLTCNVVDGDVLCRKAVISVVPTYVLEYEMYR